VWLETDGQSKEEMKEKGWMKKMKSQGFEDHTRRV
jgi:hypothetical protein